MDHKNLIAIDIHTHAEVSCRNPFDNYGEEYDRAADKYFKNGRRPTIAETVAYYREQKIGLVMFTVDSESKLGRRRIPNEEIAQAARENSDMMIAFASIDPHKGKMGAREAERLTVADKAGSVRVILRQNEDRSMFGLNGLTQKQLLSTGTEASGGGGVQFIIGGGKG